MPETSQGSPLDRFLRLFTDVKPGEASTALLLALNVFLILMAYYVLKPVREALILGEGSAELKTYLSAAQVVVLAFIVPLYGRLVERMDRAASDQRRDGVLRRLPGRLLRARPVPAFRWGWCFSSGSAFST